jgi:hypothetical protein
MTESKDPGSPHGVHQDASRNIVGRDLNIITTPGRGRKSSHLAYFLLVMVILLASGVSLYFLLRDENPTPTAPVNGTDLSLQNANLKVLSVSSADPKPGRTILLSENTDGAEQRWTPWDPSANGDWLIEAGGREEYIMKRQGSQQSVVLTQLPQKNTDGTSEGYFDEHWTFSPAPKAKGFYWIKANTANLGSW